MTLMDKYGIRIKWDGTAWDDVVDGTVELADGTIHKVRRHTLRSMVKVGGGGPLFFGSSDYSLVNPDGTVQTVPNSFELLLIRALGLRPVEGKGRVERIKVKVRPKGTKEPPEVKEFDVVMSSDDQTWDAQYNWQQQFADLWELVDFVRDSKEPS